MFPPSPFVEKFWFCRLSLNHKVLHYGDLDESPQGEVPFELLSDKSKKLKEALCFFKWRHLPTIDTHRSYTSCFFCFPPSSCIRYKVCGDWEGLSSHEGKKCSETKQGNFMFFILLLLSLMLSVLSLTSLILSGGAGVGLLRPL